MSYSYLGAIASGLAALGALTYDLMVKPPTWFLFGFWPSAPMLYALGAVTAAIIFASCWYFGTKAVGKVAGAIIANNFFWVGLTVLALGGMFATVAHLFELIRQGINTGTPDQAAIQATFVQVITAAVAIIPTSYGAYVRWR